MASIGYASLGVIVSMKGISSQINDGLSGVGKIGQRAGEQIGQGIASGVTSKKAAVEKAAAQVSKARAAEADAAGKVKVAEAQLQALRDKGVTDAGRLAAAEEKIASAKRRSALASETASNADVNLAAKKKSLADATANAGSASDQAASAMDRAGGSSTGFGSKLADAAKKAGAAALAFGGIAGVAGVLKGGFDRLMNIQRAEIMFKNIGLTSDQTNAQMKKLTEQVTGTSVSLADAAKYSAMFAQAGVDMGKPMDDAIKAFTNLSAAAQGTGIDVGRILQQVAASGKIDAGVLNQLSDAGVNAAQYLSESTGKSVAEVRKLASEGKISFNDLVGAINSGMGDFSKEMGETLPAKLSNAQTALASLGASAIEPLIGPITTVVEKLTGLVKWATKNKDLLVDLGIAVGGTALAFGALAVQQKIVAAGGLLNFLKGVVTSTKLWTAAQWLLNTAMTANPIGLIVAAVAALVAAIVIAYRNSDRFRNIVQAAWNGIKVAVSATWNWIQTTLWPGLKAVFTGIGTVVMWLWNNVIKPAWAGIKIAIEVAWNIIKGYFTVWMTVIRAVGAVVMWLWNNVMKPAWNGIKILLAVVWAGIKVAINAGMAVFRAIGAVVMWLWNNVMVPAWRGIQRAIEIAKDVIGIVIDAVKNYFQGVADKAEEVKNWLTEKWNAVVDFFKSIPGKISSAAKGMWDGIKDAFKGVINWIIRAWNSLEFTIPSVTVFGKKIGGATLSVPKLQELAQGGQVAGRRRDGLLWGPGTGTSDSILGVDALGAPTALVSAGEFVVNEAATKRWLPLLAAINGGARSLQRLATGGVVKREPYGLPKGTNTGGYGSGGSIFPKWVHDLAAHFQVKPSTYAGHQEGSGYNRGIDWVGSIPSMHKFAEYLASIRQELEQVIWMNPQTGQKIGVADGKIVGPVPGTTDAGYYRDDWAGHANHVHTRQSYSLSVPGQQPEAEAPPVDAPATPTPPPTEAPKQTSPADTSGERKSIGTTISGIAGKAVEGQVQSLLGVLGIGDSPPVLGAIDEAQRQQNEQQQSPTDPAAVTPADPTAPETPKPGRLSGWEGYAFDITEQAKKMNLVKRAAIIGNATALVEAGDPLKIWANRAVPESLKFPHDAVGSDHDSIGLFQQRDNGAWGSVADRMDPHRSAKMFYDALVKIPNWESMDMGAAAQAVQRSAFPGKYAQKIGRATELVDKAKLYDSGGWLPKGLTMTNNQTGDVEPILTRSQWADAHDAITIVKRQIAEQSAPGEPVPQVIYNIQTARVEDAFLEARKKEEQRMTAKMAGL